MRTLENAENIILKKKWLHQSIDSVIYASIRQRSIMSVFLKKKMNKCSNLEDCLSLAYRTYNIKMLQVEEEITELMNILTVMKPKFIMEIGTAAGGTLFLLSRVASPDATIISLDLPEGAFGGGYFLVKIPFYSTFATQDQKMHFVRGDSHLPHTFQMVKEILKGRKLDFLFIDGDHTYEGVKKDFEVYSTLVKKGGMIAFHDIAVHSAQSDVEVDKFWNNIKNKYQHKEFIKDPIQGWAGIGILYC